MKTYNAKYYNILLSGIAVEWKLLLLNALAAIPVQCDPQSYVQCPPILSKSRMHFISIWTLS